MKKVVFLLFVITFAACATPRHLKVKASALQTGQTKEQVVAILGFPQNVQSKGKIEVWQWCRTDFSGRYGDSYVVVWFDESVVSDISTYKNWQLGTCEKFFRAVNWDEVPTGRFKPYNQAPSKSFDLRY